MIISNKNNTVITDITSWENAFIEVDNSKHWKEGRSAHSLATYFLSPTIEQSFGMQKIKECINACGYDDMEFTHARIEHESRFDPYKGSGRMQDMVIWAQCDKCRIVVCIEAKVDETFGDTLADAYNKSVKYVKQHPTSKRKARIEDLCQKYLKIQSAEILEENGIRYQLLHYLAGSISEAKSYGNIVFMPIMVFKTSENYDFIKAKKNKEDYDTFMRTLKFAYDKQKLIYKNTIDDVEIYTCYIEISL